MDLRVLMSFVTVCRLGNITRAAEALYISQPALTRQIQELEQELGCQLLVRSTRSLSLTENGYLFMLRAQEILDLAKQAKNELSENGDILHGVIRVGIVESKIMDYFADAVVQFNKKYPHVQFEVYSADGDDLKRNLDENKLDMALLIEPVESAKYTKIPIEVTEKWGLVIREEEVSPKKKTLSYEEIIERTLILPRRYIILSEISNWFKVPESKFKVIAYHNLASNALIMVEKGLGSLLCIEGSFTNRPREGLRFLPLSPERTTSHVAVRKKNRKLSKPCEIFWADIEQYFPVRK
ncbi:LysR family transcriptional regulator [Parasutterella sp.]|uniref:LysR family transcriptional regulator n=1 Tax=Parasutterella sp. TaxID=2049037 RepID=UPI003AB704A1